MNHWDTAIDSDFERLLILTKILPLQGRSRFIFIWGLGQDMNSYKQQQGSKITKENILHVVYIFWI
jgi:hypothetical protein